MIIASIDLSRGKAVQLRQGRDPVLAVDDPLGLAADFDRTGEIAVVDIDAARGEGENTEIIRRLVRIGQCRVGGGLRTVERAEDMLGRGASRVIIGTAAFREGRVDREFLERLSERVGRDRVIIAVDAREGVVVADAWRAATGLRVEEAVPALDPYCSEFLFTSVETEGTLTGLPAERVERLRSLTANRWTVAGGVADLDEVERLSRLGVHVQLGMALYTGRINPAEGFIRSLDWSKGLIPTVVQDEAGRVLMLAYSSPESLRAALAESRMCYYSRSRGRLWFKGETSGNFQELVRLRADCDADALLATVRQRGVACHFGLETCFGDRPFLLADLQAVIEDRLRRPTARSYSASLDDDRLAEKIREEAAELNRASSRDEVVWEAADLLYFMTVRLARSGVPFGDVFRELGRRRRVR
jgi:phosphoribosyl-ATP pyrophosphohydrolase/phosphoribosyl-AMP cyclohydrolase